MTSSLGTLILQSTGINSAVEVEVETPDSEINANAETI